MTGEEVGGGGGHTEEPGTPCPHQPGPADLPSPTHEKRLFEIKYFAWSPLPSKYIPY